MKTENKTFVPFEVKEVDETARTFTGLAAAWSRDLGNDVIHKGAFARTLDHWRSSKRQRPIHLIDQHNYGSINNVLGKLVEGTETDDGLETKFEFVPDDDEAAKAFRRVKGGYITGLSIGYAPIRWDYERVEGGEEWQRIRHLHEVKLVEVSLVIWGMNEDALIDTASVKSLLARTLPSMDDQAKADLRALLEPPAPPAPAPAPPEQIERIKRAVLTLNLRRLATGSGRPARA